MRIVFSKHAILKIGQRKIPKTFILITAEKPDYIGPTRLSREVRYKKFKNYYMKVVVVKRINLLVIITAHWVSKIK